MFGLVLGPATNLVTSACQFQIGEFQVGPTRTIKLTAAHHASRGRAGRLSNTAGAAVAEAEEAARVRRVPGETARDDSDQAHREART